MICIGYGYVNKNGVSVHLRIGCSTPSKIFLFLSYHKFHMTQRGIACHTLATQCRWNPPCGNTPKDQALIWASPRLAQTMQIQMTICLL